MSWSLSASLPLCMSVGIVFDCCLLVNCFANLNHVLTLVVFEFILSMSLCSYSALDFLINLVTSLRACRKFAHMV